MTIPLKNSVFDKIKENGSLTDSELSKALIKDGFVIAEDRFNNREAHSAESVRVRIKSLIDAEPADGVLSDDGIVEILHADGVDIARRTVAKYRESMRIPSSVQRRREKGMRL